MSLILQNPLSNPTHRIKFTHLNPPTSKTPKFSIIHNPFQSLQFTKYPFHKNLYLLNNHHFHIKAYESSSISFNAENDESSSKFSSFDAFLSLMESLCLISSMVISVGCVVNWVCLKQKNSGLVLLGNKVLVWLLAGAVAVGSVIRRRQWRRVCGSPTRSKPGFESGSMIERVEKLEESMRSATSIIRMLSRQLEKLGIRFRVTKKAMKDPISETAALAQKNSEATRALALQESILEKELAEVQNVLLAMQDQQQKQLELILAIAKSGKLLESKRAPSQGAGLKKKDSGNGSTQVDGQPIQAEAVKKDATSDKVIGS